MRERAGETKFGLFGFNLYQGICQTSSSQTMHMHESHLVNLLKPSLLGPTHRVSHLVGLGWGLMIDIFNLFLGGIDAAGQGAMPRFDNYSLLNNSWC